jgi:hypothetical protein
MCRSMVVYGMVCLRSIAFSSGCNCACLLSSVIQNVMAAKIKGGGYIVDNHCGMEPPELMERGMAGVR